MRTLTAAEIDAVAGGGSVNTTRSNIKNSNQIVVNGGRGGTFSINSTQIGTITTNQAGS